MQERYIGQPSEKGNHFVCTDTSYKIVVVFEKGKFNETQKATMLEDFNSSNYMQLSRIMREMADYLQENHKELL